MAIEPWLAHHRGAGRCIGSVRLSRIGAVFLAQDGVLNAKILKKQLFGVVARILLNGVQRLASG
jgi:hypothetical protein